ncbi:MAG: T9SS type A sorting domain-containing protein [Bacteroidales bacterium]|nr:T9SS type A sorting domain-containing protein [Bacteroidales bacterium]
MKYFLFLLTLALSNTVLSQDYRNILFLDFENSNAKVSLSDGENNIWKIGHPDKSTFKTCYSGERAIMTDTVNPYPPNNRSSFTITIYKPDYEYNSDLYLEFYHAFDCDTLTDSLFLDLSFDGGETWFFGTDKMSVFEENFMQRWFQGTSFGVLNRLPVLSGNSGGWVFEQYFMHWFFPVKKSTSEFSYPDSIIFRFNIISDSIQTNKDGWLIDNIKIQSWLGSGIDSREFENISVYPNPSDNILDIESASFIESVEIFDGYGQLKYSLSEINSQYCHLNIEGLLPGMYILKFQTSDGYVLSKKIIKNSP